MCWKECRREVRTSILELSMSELLLWVIGVPSCWGPQGDCVEHASELPPLNRKEARKTIHQLVECCTTGSNCLAALRWGRRERQAGAGSRKLLVCIVTARQLQVSTK